MAIRKKNPVQNGTNSAFFLANLHIYCYSNISDTEINLRKYPYIYSSNLFLENKVKKNLVWEWTKPLQK